MPSSIPTNPAGSFSPGHARESGGDGAASASPAAELASRYHAVCDRVSRAAARSGRSAADIILVAVTKHADSDQLRGLIDLGHRDFGENRVQTLIQHAAMVEEYLARLRVVPSAARPDLAGGRLLSAVRSGHGSGGQGAAGQGSAALARTSGPVRWHLIGHLQRNKARKALEFVRLVHSVDSLRLAEELQAIANRREEPIDVLLQVNCSNEDSKFGCPVPAAQPLAEQIDTMANVRVRGLMTMAPLVSDPEQTRSVFRRCKEIFEEIRSEGVGGGHFNILSMGMSGDFEVAIEEGANVVRVGTAIFGESKEVDRAEAEDDSTEH